MKIRQYLSEITLPQKKWTVINIQKLDKIMTAKLWFMYNKVYRSEGFQKLGSVDFHQFLTKHKLMWLINLDSDPEPDAFISYRKEKYGNKVVLLASDGEMESKSVLVKQLLKLMKTRGWFMEASHKVAKILMKNNVPYLDDEEKVKKILYPDIVWLGDGEYERYLRGTNMLMRERIFGRPNI